VELPPLPPLPPYLLCAGGCQANHLERDSQPVSCCLGHLSVNALPDFAAIVVEELKEGGGGGEGGRGGRGE